MARYTVTQLARISGVSVRTLHHYDAIGLLEPAHVGDNQYRYYGREELLRLQDILFHRELGMPLAAIGAMLDGESDRLSVLQRQRVQLSDRLAQTSDLLRTIDRRIAELNGENEMQDKELYNGFDPKKQAQYEDELVEKLGDNAREGIEHSKQHWGKEGSKAFDAALSRGSEAEVELAEQFKAGIEASSQALDPLLDKHRNWISEMWGRECPHEAYGGMADLYQSNPDFRDHFDKRGEGFLDWLAEAMKSYSARG